VSELFQAALEAEVYDALEGLHYKRRTNAAVKIGGRGSSALQGTRKYWRLRTDQKRFLVGGEMPNVFSTFKRTELVAFLCVNGPTDVRSLAAAFNVHPTAMMRRLQSTEHSGLIQGAVSACGYSRYNRINIRHPAYRQILTLGKKLGDLFTIPSPSGLVGTRRLAWADTTRAYDVIDMLANAANLPVRGEILLFLAALEESVPISRLSGVLSRARYSVQKAVDGLESFRILISIRDYPRRLIKLNDDWEAYPEMLRLLRRLNKVDSTYAELAAAYRDAGGKVVYYW